MPDLGRVVTHVSTELFTASLDEEQVKRLVTANLGGHEVPRDVGFVDELPRTSTGKVLERELKEGGASTVVRPCPSAPTPSSSLAWACAPETGAASTCTCRSTSSTTGASPTR